MPRNAKKWKEIQRTEQMKEIKEITRNVKKCKEMKRNLNKSKEMYENVRCYDMKKIKTFFIININETINLIDIVTILILTLFYEYEYQY